MTKNDEPLWTHGILNKRACITKQDRKMSKSVKITPPKPETGRLHRNGHLDSIDSSEPVDPVGAGSCALLDDEEDGRFFGGGITKLEADILDYVDDQSNDGNDTALEHIDIAWLKRAAIRLQRYISQNSELRAKFFDEPQKFIASEANLDAEIRSLSILSEYPHLYPDLVRLGCAADIVGLLSHDNTDIAMDALEIMGELTDDDAAADNEQWSMLVDALLEADCLDLLVSNFLRLDEMNESDRNGVYYGLGFLENICSRKSICEQLAEHCRLLEWLISRARRPEDIVSQNKQYSTELLAILTQSSPEIRSKLVELDAADTLLQLVAPYRKVDPKNSTYEKEYMENLFETLACIVDYAEGKVKFIDAEGVELCLIMLKSGNMSRQPALRLLDHATAGVSGGRVCQKLVEEGGLKTIFTTFMKKDDNTTIQHLLAIFASMFRLLPRHSAERIRTLAKFVERDYEKLTKILKYRAYYVSRVLGEGKRIDEAGIGTAAESQLVARVFGSGLYSLQMINVILAWLAVEDGSARSKIQETLQGQGSDFGSVVSSLQEQLLGLDLEFDESEGMREMLTVLVDYLS